jgi:hypothetical protein
VRQQSLGARQRFDVASQTFVAFAVDPLHADALYKILG